MIEFWRAGGTGDSTSPAAAGTVEAQGWDGQMFMDSQCIGTDPYVLMGAWAVRTERLKLSTGVTNPLTRHPVVTASAAASVHAISGGRAVLGIGRGDSSLAYLGKAPARLSQFERTLEKLQVLLSGREIGFEDDEALADAPPIESLSLGARPTDTRLNWLPAELPKVPLDVAATGPKVIRIGARLAERVTFSVGAMPERIRWGLDIAAAERLRLALEDDGTSYGAQVLVVCDTDVNAALEWAGTAAAPLARFQVMQGDSLGPTPGSDDADLAAVRTSYDMTKHGGVHEHKLVGARFSPDFLKRFAVVGPPDHCIERLIELVRCGLRHLVIVGPGFYPDPRDLFATEVMPAIRIHCSGVS